MPENKGEGCGHAGGGYPHYSALSMLRSCCCSSTTMSADLLIGIHQTPALPCRSLIVPALYVTDDNVLILCAFVRCTGGTTGPLRLAHVPHHTPCDWRHATQAARRPAAGALRTHHRRPGGAAVAGAVPLSGKGNHLSKAWHLANQESCSVRHARAMSAAVAGVPLGYSLWQLRKAWHLAAVCLRAGGGTVAGARAQTDAGM